jgi:ADP-heptose:LPS heptosyltransferase
MHFGRLLGIPSVSFWGPTEPNSRLRPWAEIREEIHYQRLSCSPCVHLADNAPCRGNNICMRLAVDPDAGNDRNPAWIVTDEPLPRFTRLSGP